MDNENLKLTGTLFEKEKHYVKTLHEEYLPTHIMSTTQSTCLQVLIRRQSLALVASFLLKGGVSMSKLSIIWIISEFVSECVSQC